MNVFIFTTLDFRVSCAAKQRLSRLASSLESFGHNSYLAFRTSEQVKQPYLLENKNIIFTLPVSSGFSLFHRNKLQVHIFRRHIDIIVSNLSIDIVILYSTYSDVIDPSTLSAKNLASLL